MSEHEDAEVWDFSLPDRPKRFRFNGTEVYEAPAVLSPATLRAMVAMRGHLAAEGGDPTARFDQIRDLLAQILTPESRPRFVARFDSEDDAIDIRRQLIPCFYRLLEAYGLRPTQPSSPSSTGGEDTGTDSTAGPPPEESTPSSSQPTAGSILSTTTSTP